MSRATCVHCGYVPDPDAYCLASDPAEPLHCDTESLARVSRERAMNPHTPEERAATLDAYRAALAADDAYQAALVAWVGKKRAGDARYMPRGQQPENVAAARDALHKATAAWQSLRETRGRR